jgi:hypothetical protein
VAACRCNSWQHISLSSTKAFTDSRTALISVIRIVEDDRFIERHSMSTNLLPALPRMAEAFRKELPNGIPEGTGFHAFRHAYNALIAQIGTDDLKKVNEVQMKLLRHGDERTNDRYGKLASRFVSVPVRHISTRAMWRWET